MCSSNVHQDRPPIEVLAAIQHNLLTSADDLDVFRAVHAPADPTTSNLQWASEQIMRIRDRLLSEIDRLRAPFP